MKKVKSLVALFLVICLCLTSMVMVCSAADTRAITVVTCQRNGVNFRRSTSTSSDDNIIGVFLAGEKLHARDNSPTDWYYGVPDTDTEIYRQYNEQMLGYSYRRYFSSYT